MTDKLDDGTVKFVLYMELNDSIKKDKQLKSFYTRLVDKHNKCIQNDLYYDSGFDLSMSSEIQNTVLKPNTVTLMPLGVRCACYKFYSINPERIPVYSYIQEAIKRGRMKNVKSQPFLLLPRSSMWKSGVMLANSKGVIDSGYRGFLFAPLYNFKSEDVKLKYKNKYLQICMPGLERFFIKIVDEIKTDTQRGSGGFGSTGK